ncbi:MAG: hypothetical protein K6A38_02630 [Lachnospiraceae bacterium]|nr:hypothetical protein [Lachnospiraceae bacterium]
MNRANNNTIKRYMALAVSSLIAVSSVATSYAVPIYAYADTFATTDDVPEDNNGYRNLASGDTLTDNTGTIHQNDGTITNNSGTVESNSGTVQDNWGDVTDTGSGHVETNHSSGTVSGGSVTNNFGSTSNANVTNNYSGASAQGTGTVYVNYGTTTDVTSVNHNFGLVENTASGSGTTVTRNYQGAVIRTNGVDTAGTQQPLADLLSGSNVTDPSPVAPGQGGASGSGVSSSDEPQNVIYSGNTVSTQDTDNISNPDPSMTISEKGLADEFARMIASGAEKTNDSSTWVNFDMGNDPNITSGILNILDDGNGLCSRTTVLSFFHDGSYYFLTIPKGCHLKSASDTLKVSGPQGFMFIKDLISGCYLKKYESLAGDSNSSLREQAMAALDLINSDRLEAGLDELDWNSTLEVPIEKHSDSDEPFTHSRPDGSDWHKVDPSLIEGDSLAYGFDTAEDVVDAWMQSPTHRDNILYDDFEKNTISIYEDFYGTWSRAQQFGY